MQCLRLPSPSHLLVRALLPALVAAAAWLGSAVASAQIVEEVPFITSPDNVTLEMLRISSVGPRDHVIDLGSGDGRIVILAAKRFGATGLGVEIVPELVRQSVRSAQAAGVADKVEFREQDLFATDLSRATVITMYLLPEVNMKLRPGLLQLQPGTRLVSHDWDMGDWEPDQTVVLPVPDKKVGLEKLSRVHLWVVPARVEGLWCGAGGVQLRVAQRFQVFTGSLVTGAMSRAVVGNILGNTLHLAAGGQLAFDAAGRLRVAGPVNGLLSTGTTLARATGSSCSG